MDLTREQLIEIDNGTNEVKAEFASLYMPTCTSEYEFHQALQAMIDAAPETHETPDPGEPNGPTA